jgi:hypothetical protein
MEPLNKKERSLFILKFTAAFAGGIIILLIPFYFILRMPSDENSIRAEDFNSIQKQIKFQEDVFAAKIDTARIIVQKYDLPGQDIDKLNADLGLLLSEMENTYQDKDTPAWIKKMYDDIVKSFIDLKKAKNDKIRSDNDLKECKQDLEKAKEEASKNKDTMGG